MSGIEIPLSKTRMFFSFSSSLLFVIIGIYLIITPADTSTTMSIYIIKGFGLIAVLFFGIMAIVLIRRLYDPKPALIIDEKGITDNSGPAAVGFIDWADVSAIRHYDKNPVEFIVIELKDPEKYIAKQESVKAKWIRQQIHTTGSPVSISPKSIQYNFLKLENLIKAEFERYKSLNS